MGGAPGTDGAALSRHDEILTAVLKRSGGCIFALGGDGLAVAFQRAGNAIDAAIDAQRQLSAEPWPEAVALRVRMALHTGEATERDGNYFGPPVNRTARLLGVAAGGQIVVSRATVDVVGEHSGFELVDIGDHHLRGVPKPMRVHLVKAEGLIEVDRAERPSAPPSPTDRRPTAGWTLDFVGRDRELGELTDTVGQFDRRRGIASVAVIEGDPGSGKSRLIEELIKVCAQTGVGVVVGRADGLPFEPIKMMVRSLLDVEGAARAIRTPVRLGLSRLLPELALSGDPAPVDLSLARSEMLDSIVEVLAEVGAPLPMALVFDDFQWVDEESAAVFRALLAREWDRPVRCLVISLRTRRTCSADVRSVVTQALRRDGAICHVLGRLLEGRGGDRPAAGTATRRGRRHARR